jgi:hypothetical protein
MDKDKLAAVQAELDTIVDGAGTLADALVPEFHVYVALGKAVAKAVPSLYDDVEKLLQKAAPTDEDKAALAAKIVALQNPETL